MPAKAQKRRRKHVPQRTCVGCRDVLEKRALVRVVRTPEGIFVDPSGRRAGRGAYFHSKRSCWERGIKQKLARALKTTLTPEDVKRLTEFLKSLPEEPPSQE